MKDVMVMGNILPLKAKIKELTEENERLKSLNAQLMGDDENKPRYTTKRLRQEIERATQELQRENTDLKKSLEWYGVDN